MAEFILESYKSPSHVYYNVEGKIEWSIVDYGSSASITVRIYAKKNSVSTGGTTGTWPYSITIGGSTTSSSVWDNVGTSWRQLGSYTKTVSGDSVWIGGSVEAPSGTSISGDGASGGLTITIRSPAPPPADPDPSTISTASNCKFGDASMVSWTSNSSSYSFKVSFSCGNYNAEYTVRPASSGLVQQSLIVPYDLMNAVSGMSGTVTVTLSTYKSSGSQVGSASTKTISCTVPDNDNTKPQVTSASFLPSPDLIGGGYVQGNTGAKLEDVAASGKYGASIVSYYFRVEGKNYNRDGSSDVIAQFGSVSLTAFAVDSRGLISNGFAVAVDVIPYSKPMLRPVEGQYRVTASRCNAEGTADADGTHLIIRAKREYSPVVFDGEQKNFCAIQYRYKPDTSTAWSAYEEILDEQAEENEVTTGPLIGTLDPFGTYQVEIMAIDTLGGSGTTILTVSSDIVFAHTDGQLGSVGFGKYVELPDVLDIAETKTLILRGGIDLRGDTLSFFLGWIYPIGSIFETVNNENPGGTLGGTWVLMETTESSTKWRRTE